MSGCCGGGCVACECRRTPFKAGQTADSVIAVAKKTGRTLAKLRFTHGDKAYDLQFGKDAPPITKQLADERIRLELVNDVVYIYSTGEVVAFERTDRGFVIREVTWIDESS